jgi:uncharacterized membrane protein
MAQLFEALMLIAFGVSWPFSIVKSIRSRTAKGKSMVFMVIVIFGYLCGITSKLISGNITYVFAFYIIDLVMVTTDLALYLRNAKLDRQREQGAQ